ncbi:UNVERIFIED_CONTAM: hypothetical protein FKN15_012462 [Acipenser sinensis]
MAASLKQTTSEIATAFDKLLSSSTLRLVRTHDAGCVSVLAVERYVAVPGPSVNNNKPTTTCYYSYDVTVTDGVYRAKCQLASELNTLVHKCVLRTGVEIRIVQCSFLYNEKCLRPGCVLIEGIEFGGERSPLLQTLTQEDAGSLPFFTSRVRNVLAQSDGPLKVEKKHYLPLWNNDDPYGVLWKCDIAPPSNGQALECNYEAERYWTYRWVHIVDDTTEQPFILEIFASSQPEAFSNIYPMSYLVCTQMRVVGEARGHTMNYLTSSNESQVYCAGYHRGQPYVSHPRVKSFIKWTKTLSEEALLRKTVIGGYYRFPHSPDTFAPSSDDSEAPSLTSTSELQQEMEALHYREHRCLAVQGFIAAVRYVAWPAAWGASGGQPEQVGEEQPNSLQREMGFRRSAVDHDVMLFFMPVPAAASSSETQEPQDQAHQGSPAALAGAGTPLSESGEQNNRTTDTAAKQTRCPYNLRVTKSEQDAPTDEKTVQADPRKRSRPQQDDSEQPDPVLATECILFAADCQSSSDTLAVVTLEEVPSPSWECGVWSAVQQHLSVHLNHSLHSASVPRKFDYKRREFLMQQHNLHPAKWQPPPAAATACDIEEFIPVCNHGYYVVTIMGVNQQVAIDAVFLPVTSPDDPRRVGQPQAPHDNTLLSCLTEGFVSPESTVTAGWGGAGQSFPSPGKSLGRASATVVGGNSPAGASVVWTALLEISYRSPGSTETVSEVCECGLYGLDSPLHGASGVVGIPSSADLDACEEDTHFTVSEAPWIALIERGNCTFTDKIKVAVRNGASAVVIFNVHGTGNETRPMVHSGRNLTPSLPVPAMFIKTGQSPVTYPPPLCQAQHGLNGHLPPQSQSRKRGKHSVHGGGQGGRSGTPQFFMAGSPPPWGSGHSVVTPGEAGSLATPVEAGYPKTPGDGSSSGPSGGDGSSSGPSGGDGSSKMTTHSPARGVDYFTVVLFFVKFLMLLASCSLPVVVLFQLTRAV